MKSGRWVVLGTLLLLGALVLATAGGPVDYVSAPASTQSPGTQSRPTTTPTKLTGPPVLLGEEPTPGAAPSWLLTGLQVLFLLLAVVSAYLLLRAGQYVLDLGRHGTPRRAVPPPARASALPEVPEELVGPAAARRRAALVEGEPRNAIVAAWVDLEESAAASGLGRRPAETPREYVSRVLKTWDVDIAALSDLADLYEEARFSAHPLGPEQHARALRNLDRVHEHLAAAQGQPDGSQS
jgi:hypothetical protein